MVYKRHIGENVFDMAVQRLIEVYEEGHRVVCSLSGGKDSGACLELCIIAARATGNLPVDAVIQDEEIAYPGTYEYVERMFNRPEVNGKWVICNQPMVNIFDRANPYFWVFDPDIPESEWVRTPPKQFTIEIPEINIEKIVHPAIFPPAEGKGIVDVVGLRVHESAKRYLAMCSSRGSLTGWGPRGGVPYAGIRPIYDWTDGDIWRAHKENDWDYNEAYDVMYRLGVPRASLRIGPPTMNIAGARHLPKAASAWPQWFDRVCTRLKGVRSVSKFGVRACQPFRRKGETWKDCFERTCINEAPDWIAERSTTILETFIKKHESHSNTDLPEIRACMPCGCGSIASWRLLTNIMYSGDPFSLKTASAGLGYMEPGFFKPSLAGTGKETWGGKPTW